VQTQTLVSVRSRLTTAEALESVLFLALFFGILGILIRREWKKPRTRTRLLDSTSDTEQRDDPS